MPKTAKIAGNTTDKLNELYLTCLEPPARPVDPLSAEELERGRLLARRYTIGLMRRHKIQEKDLQQKIRHKWRAIHALPTLELRKEALTVTDPCVPLDRPLAAFTPPLRGFHWAASLLLRKRHPLALHAGGECTLTVTTSQGTVGMGRCEHPVVEQLCCRQGSRCGS